MGRIKTVLTKRTTHRLMELHRDEFTSDFEKNKELVDKFTIIQSKKLRNVIAGYITRLVRKGNEPKQANYSMSSDIDYSEIGG